MCRWCWLFVPASPSDSKLVRVGEYMTRYAAMTKHEARTAQIKPPIEVASSQSPPLDTAQLLRSMSKLPRSYRKVTQLRQNGVYSLNHWPCCFPMGISAMASGLVTRLT